MNDEDTTTEAAAGTHRPPVTTDEYFGGCPECGRNDGYYNVRSDHWFKCDTHRTRWLVGSRLFSSWFDEGESDWTLNMWRYGEYREVEPLAPEKRDDQRLTFEAARARLGEAAALLGLPTNWEPGCDRPAAALLIDHLTDLDKRLEGDESAALIYAVIAEIASHYPDSISEQHEAAEGPSGQG